jgi:hypothetical protein
VSVLERAVVLPTLAFTTAWSMLDLGRPPAVLGTDTQFWVADTARRELEAATLQLLAGHGLARKNQLNELWRATLQVIDAAEREYYAWSGRNDGTHQAALVALRGEDAVRLLVTDTNVEVRPLPVKWPATSLYDTLPDVPGARVRTVTVPVPDAETASDPFADHTDEDYLRQMTARPQDAVHQLYTARRADGVRSRSLPVTALDLTGHGRVLVYRTGDDQIVLKPGPPSEVVRTLNATHEAL